MSVSPLLLDQVNQTSLERLLEQSIIVLVALALGRLRLVHLVEHKGQDERTPVSNLALRLRL